MIDKAALGDLSQTFLPVNTDLPALTDRDFLFLDPGAAHLRNGVAGASHTHR